MTHNEKIKQAVDYLSGEGYGSGSNYTTMTVASLMVEYAERQASNKSVVMGNTLPKLPEFAATNFDNIAEISTRLTTGNVSHHARTIEGLAKRNAEFIRKHYLSE